ncbi:MAG TPA: hypothetical protein VJI67_00125 [archaeon]|nr:hypothetical protein [archaeon]
MLKRKPAPVQALHGKSAARILSPLLKRYWRRVKAGTPGVGLKEKLALSRRRVSTREAEESDYSGEVPFLRQELAHEVRALKSALGAGSLGTAKRIRIHPTGWETRLSISVPHSRGFKVVKVVRQGSGESLGNAPIEARYKYMAQLSEHGAPVVKPYRLTKTKGDEYVWEEEDGGVRVVDLLGNARTKRERETIQALMRRAETELRAHIEALGLKSSEWNYSPMNMVYGKGRIKFIDLHFPASPSN